MVACHNWWYGLALPKHTGKLVHLFFGLATVAGWAALWLWCGPDLVAWLQQTGTQAGGGFGFWLVAGYLGLCWLVGLVVVPYVTLSRLLRGQPAGEVSVRSQVLDVPAKLGYRPTGRGKGQWLASLPGNQICTVEMVERTLRLPRLPAAWDGLSILHLSDLHLCGTPDRHFYRVVMEHCAAWEPDLVCVTGDIADSFHHQGWIVPALGWLRWKVAAFAILGNHDYYYDPPFIRRRLTRLGMTYLGNGWQQAEVRGEPLVVIGHEGPWGGPAPDLTGCPTGPFRLCLSHTPDNIRWARRHGIDLMLSGHVHGGQIRFPILGSLLVPSRYGRRYDCGTFHEKPTFLHVSRGLGGEHPVRYGCRPEVTRIILQAG
jgi:predicted MPP superfamily phosphohydrolase